MVSVNLLLASLLVLSEPAVAIVDLTSVTVRSDAQTVQTDVPITFGQAFKAGDLIDASSLGISVTGAGAVPAQVDAKAFHPDGSVRHAVVTAVLPTLEPGQQAELRMITPASGASGSSVSLDQLLATGFDAQVNLNVNGVAYSASARDFLQNNATQTWLSGPLVSEWLVNGAVEQSNGNAHPHLTARFHVRAYAGLESVRVSVTVENSRSRASAPSNFAYDASVVVQGKGTQLQQDGVTHYRQARWRRVFWWGNEPRLQIAHDSSYLQEMGVVPTYDPRLQISNGTLAQMESEWSGNKTRLMGSGLIYTYMPGGGGRRDIAPLPRWTARYLMSQDERARRSMLGTAEQAGSFGIHYRDSDTDLPISLDTYPNATVAGNNSVFPSCGGNCGTPYTPDVAHQPSLAFVPYMITGDYFYLEELQFWANWNLFYWGDHGGSQGLMVNDQIRAQAWGLRTVGHAAYITPDNHPLKAYFNAKLRNNLNWYQVNVVDNDASPLGYLLNPPDLGLDNTFATWMDDFFTWSVGHLANLGFVEAEPVFEYKARFPVGRMTHPDYCWILASTYWTRARDQQSGNAFDNWADYKVAVIRAWDSGSVGPSFSEIPPSGMTGADEDALINAACNSQTMSDILGLQRGEMIGLAWSHEGYVANMQPAVAMVAERGVTAGDTAWSIFDSRSVVPDSDPYDYSISPQWAIVPGNIDLGAPGGGQRPVVSLSASPINIEEGESTTLTWSSINADSCVASGDWSGSRPVDGSEETGPLSGNNTFRLSCSNGSGSTESSVTVVASAPGPEPLEVSFNSDRNAVEVGQNVNLSWTTTNASSCQASGGWSGSKPLNGEESVGPIDSDTTFTLTCQGDSGELSRSVTVQANAAAPSPPPAPPPTGDDTGDSGSTDSGGGAPSPLLILALLASLSRRGFGCNDARRRA